MHAKSTETQLKQHEMAKEQLEWLYQIIRQDNDKIITIRKWCITVWLASIFIKGKSGTLGLDLTVSQATYLPFIPIILFLILDAFECTFINLHQIRARTLETALAYEDFSSISKKEYFYYIGYDMITFQDKIYAFIKSFTHETVISFYMLLLLTTLIFTFTF